MPHTMRLALAVRAARRTDGPRRLMGLCALGGAGLIAAGLVLAVVGSSSALTVGLIGVALQVGGLLGALWWTVHHHPPPRCDRGRA